MELVELNANLDAARAEFEALGERLQAEYEAGEKKLEEVTKEIKPKMKMLKAAGTVSLKYGRAFSSMAPLCP